MSQTGTVYAWGMTSTTGDYSYSGYDLCDKQSYSSKYTKYTVQDNMAVGYVADGLTRLEACDDVAQANAFGRMPTKAEAEEFIEKCTVRKDYFEGDSHKPAGYYVTGPNGKTIFIPAFGYRQGSYYRYETDCAYIWTSDLDTSSDSKSAKAFALRINEYDMAIVPISRISGLMIRSVQE